MSRHETSAQHKQKKENGLAWAAKMRLEHDEDFWTKWDAMPAECQLLDPPPADGRRCPRCKMKLYFLANWVATFKESCDGLCDKRANKLVTTFGLDRFAFVENTGAKAKSGAKAKGAPPRVADKNAAVCSITNKQGKATQSFRQPAKVRRCLRAEDDIGFKCAKAAKPGSSYCSPRCERIALGLSADDALPSERKETRRAPAAPVGSEAWAATQRAERAAAPRPPPRRSAEDEARAREARELDRVIAESLRESGGGGPAEHSEFDADLERALALSAAEFQPAQHWGRGSGIDYDAADVERAMEASRAVSPRHFAPIPAPRPAVEAPPPPLPPPPADVDSLLDAIVRPLLGAAPPPGAPPRDLWGLLASCRLEHLHGVFAAEEIDLDTLSYLSAADLVADMHLQPAEAQALVAARDDLHRGAF